MNPSLRKHLLWALMKSLHRSSPFLRMHSSRIPLVSYIFFTKKRQKRTIKTEKCSSNGVERKIKLKKVPCRRSRWLYRRRFSEGHHWCWCLALSFRHPSCFTSTIENVYYVLVLVWRQTDLLRKYWTIFTPHIKIQFHLIWYKTAKPKISIELVLRLCSDPYHILLFTKLLLHQAQQNDNKPTNLFQYYFDSDKNEWQRNNLLH